MSASSAASPLPYLVLGFLVYLYLPHIFFKMGAEKWVDLGRKKDSTQIEEFLSAALPSTVLNLLACIFIFLPRFGIHFFLILPLEWIESLLSSRFWHVYYTCASWLPGAVDWAAVARLTSSGATSGEFATYVGRGAWWGELAYVLWLYVLSIFNGRMYGRIVRARIKRRATKPHLQGNDIFANMTRSGEARWLVGSLFWRLWHPFYHEFHVPMFSWVLMQECVWLRTCDGRIFFGRFFEYQKGPTGDMAGLTLNHVFQYKIAETRQKLTPFVGQVYFPSHTIADLNLTSLDSFNSVRRRLAREATAAAARSRDNPFD